MKLKNLLVIMVLLVLGVATFFLSGCDPGSEKLEHNKLLQDMKGISTLSEFQKVRTLISSDKKVNSIILLDETDFSSIIIRYEGDISCSDDNVPEEAPFTYNFCNQQGLRLRKLLRKEIPSLKNRPL